MAAKPNVTDLAVAERADLHALVTSLSPEEWHRPSLCEGWTVRDVVVHVVSYDELGWSRLPGAFLRGGLRVDAVNQHVLERYANLTVPEVVDLVARSSRPRGLTSGFGGAIALTDGLIHQQDVRRATGRVRTIPEDRLTVALDFALRAPTLPARGHARGLRLVASDLSWEHGDGAEVRGPGEALLMAVAGRSQALGELEGDGVATLARRLRAVS
ncbi:maleylpyruvate isomerase family mycothiol-dependent enzyme [Aeromicrobium sp.]|uniref:maleylpyruvate isomerase family mycothiol-dependent enzyme n=1 Tax=Aeromicrobium sp. TaxID=1871063 RepID=UPI0035115490